MLISVIEQTYGNIEHIVQDGGSTDQTLEIIRRLSPLSKVESARDGGLYHALNNAMMRCTGDIIGLIHADDVLFDRNVISEIAACFTRSECDAVYGDLIYVDRRDVKKVRRKWTSGQYNNGDFLWGWMPPHPAFFIRRNVILKHGGYDLTLKTAADYEWMLRMIHLKGIRLTYLPKTIVAMRLGGKSNRNLSSRIRANFEDRKAWKINGISPRWYTLFLKPLRKLPQFFNQS